MTNLPRMQVHVLKLIISAAAAAAARCIKRPRGGSNIPCSTGLFCTVNQVCDNGVCGGGR
jgi:hypothetical protein